MTKTQRIFDIIGVLEDVEEIFHVISVQPNPFRYVVTFSSNIIVEKSTIKNNNFETLSNVLSFLILEDDANQKKNIKLIKNNSKKRRAIKLEVFYLLVQYFKNVSQILLVRQMVCTSFFKDIITITLAFPHFLLFTIWQMIHFHTS